MRQDIRGYRGNDMVKRLDLVGDAKIEPSILGEIVVGFKKGSDTDIFLREMEQTLPTEICEDLVENLKDYVAELKGILC